MKEKLKEEKKMLTLLFSFFLIGFIFEVIAVAFKLTWGIVKVIATIVGTIIVGVLLFGAGLSVVAIVGIILASIAGLCAITTA